MKGQRPAEQTGASRRQDCAREEARSGPRPSVLGLMGGIVRLGHPLPTVVTALATVAFYQIARGSAQPDGRSWQLLLACLLLLYSIGSMNDCCDEPLDRRAGRIDKPLVAGVLPRRAAFHLWLAAAILAVLVAAWIGPMSAAMVVLLWSAGAAYNLWAKASIFSWLPFVVFYPSLPVWAFIAADNVHPTLLLAYPVLALLSVALNIANTLPDLELDAAGGLRGLTHQLGVERAHVALWSCFAATLALMSVVPPLLGFDLARVLPGIVGGILLLGAMMVDRLHVRSPATRRRGFHLSIAQAVVLGLSWIACLA